MMLQASKRDEHNGVTGCRLRAWLLFLGIRQDAAHVRDNRRYPGVHHALPKRVAHPSTTTTTVYEQSGGQHGFVASTSAFLAAVAGVILSRRQRACKAEVQSLSLLCLQSQLRTP
jgi:hypothetical protein